jgi:hypothetical protein
MGKFVLSEKMMSSLGGEPRGGWERYAECFAYW